MIDSHAHLTLAKAPAAEQVAAARRVGVERILTVGIDERSNGDAVRAAHELDGVYACVGRHPNSAEGYDEEAAAAIERLARLAQEVVDGYVASSVLEPLARAISLD